MKRRMLMGGMDPLKSQQFKTQRPELPEDLWQPLYDRTNLSTTVPSESSFFSVPKGQTATLITGTSAASKTKTFRDTNIETANVIPSKMHVLVGLSMGWISASNAATTAPVDRELLKHNGYFKLRIIDKDVLYLPLISVPELNPISAVATTATATTMVASQSGGGSGIRMYKFPIKLTLNPYENFTCSIVYDGTVTISTTHDAVCLLQGYMRRPT